MSEIKNSIILQDKSFPIETTSENNFYRVPVLTKAKHFAMYVVHAFLIGIFLS